MVRQVCHRDLKLENLLLNGDRTHLKISDFGFAKNLGAGSVAATIIGTARYVAPEQLDGSSYCGFKADMWACGIILFIMRECAYPFRFSDTGGVGAIGQREATAESLHLQELLQTAQYTLRRASSQLFREMLSGLLNPDPMHRFSAADALRHPWILGEDWEIGDVNGQLAAMDTEFITTPEGEQPEHWLEKLAHLPSRHSAAPGGRSGTYAGFDEESSEDDGGPM